MNDLFLNGVILNSFLNSFNGNILGISVMENLRDVLSLVLNCVVVSHYSFFGDLNDLSNFVIFKVGSFIRDIFHS